MLRILAFLMIFLPSLLFACGPTMEDLQIFLAFIVVIIVLFIYSFRSLKKGKSKWFLLGLVPFLYLLLQIAYIYVAQETDWLDKKPHASQKLHPWKVEIQK